MNVAVIGVGNMGQHHARIYSELSNVTLIGVCDLDKKRGLEIANRYNTEYFASVDALYTSRSIDAVSIAVPTTYHYQVAMTCLKKGSNILLEKPIAGTITDARKIVAFAKKQNKTLVIGHIERFNPAIQKLVSLVETGDLGEITACIARRVGGVPPLNKDIDIATDLAIHDIDIINYLLKRLPTKITVNKNRYHTDKDDSVEIFLQYGQTSAYIQANWITPVKIRKFHITGTKGYVEVDYITQQIEFYKSNAKQFLHSAKGFSDYVLQFSSPEKEVIAVDKKEPLKEEICFFIDAAKQNKMIDNTHAIDSLKIALL